MPTKVELDDYLQRAESVPRPDVDERLNHLHRVTSRRQQWPELCIFAFDHRKQLADLARETGRDEACIPQLKLLLLLAAAEAAAQEAGLDQRSGILADGTYGQRALNAITGKGWWIGRPIELPSSRPLRLSMQHRLAADRLAAGACRQMPGLLSPGRSGGAACRAGCPAARGLAGL